MNLFHIV